MAAGQVAKGPDQRRQLLAMQSEVRTIRAELIRRSREIADQINIADAQFGAASAYARGAKLRRGVSTAPNKAMD
jgi:hypothetical protein